jgi:hypothetical protein
MHHTHRVVFALLVVFGLVLGSSSHTALADAGAPQEAARQKEAMLGKGAAPGDAEPGSVASIAIENKSTINGMTVGFANENNKTTIWLRICADAPNYQLRSENIGRWTTELFNRTQRTGGCSPSPTSWWRMVQNADPNTGEVFRIYGYASDTLLGEAAFMERAARTECRVTGLAQGVCTPAAPGKWSAPRMEINAPTAGQIVSGTINVGGWAVDLGEWSGPGVDQVHIYNGSTFLGAASYGFNRSDVASAFGDARFANSGFGFSLDTRALPDGATTLRVAARSTITGAWNWSERVVNVDNSIPAPTYALEVYNAADYTGGYCWSNAAETANIHPSCNEQISSVRLRSGWAVRVYRDRGQAGPSACLTASDANLTDNTYEGGAPINDTISSFVLYQQATCPTPVAVVVPPPLVPAPVPCDVPFFWQSDPRWKNDKLGACTGVCSTIGPCGCALTSTAMVFKYYGVDTDPGRLGKCLGAAACHLQWGKAPDCSGGKVSWGRSSWPAFSWSALEAELRQGRPAILQLNLIKDPSQLHFVVAVSGSGTRAQDYVVNDPGMKGGATVPLSAVLARGYKPPTSMRLYAGQRNCPQSVAGIMPAAIPKLQAPSPTAVDGVTGTVVLFRNTDDRMTLELAAQSLAGEVSQMRVWSDANPDETWQTFAPFVELPLSERFYVQFRDTEGNETGVISEGFNPAGSPPEGTPYEVMLPMVRE